MNSSVEELDAKLVELGLVPLQELIGHKFVAVRSSDVKNPGKVFGDNYPGYVSTGIAAGTIAAVHRHLLVDLKGDPPEKDGHITLLVTPNELGEGNVLRYIFWTEGTSGWKAAIGNDEDEESLDWPIELKLL